MERGWAVWGLLILLNVVLPVSGLAAEEKPPGEIWIATGTRGGTDFQFGMGLAALLHNHLHLDVHTLASPGALQNARMVARGNQVEAVQVGRGDKAFWSVMPKDVNDAKKRGDPRKKVRVQLALMSDFAPREAGLPAGDLANLKRVLLLGDDALQLAVRRSAGIRNVTDLKRRKVYVGAKESGTRRVAQQVLSRFGLRPDIDYVPYGGSYSTAARNVSDGKWDAAFFLAGVPTLAVQWALNSGNVALLSFDRRPDLGPFQGYARLAQIPANSYPGIPRRNTWTTRNLLVAARDLPAFLVRDMLALLFDHQEELLNFHPAVEDIRLLDNLEELEGDRREEIAPHPGLEAFREEEKSKLKVATGTLLGTAFPLGRHLAEILNEEGITARAINTDGSQENARLLMNRTVDLALVQNDVAIQYSNAFQKSSGLEPMRLLAFLYPEALHIVVRDHGNDHPATVSQLLKGRAGKPLIGIGRYEARGKRLREEDVLTFHGFVEGSSGRTVKLSTPQALALLTYGMLDSALFSSGVPMHGVRQLLQPRSGPQPGLEGPVQPDPQGARLRLLSIDPKRIQGLVANYPFLTPYKIPAYTYPEQRQTVQTVAVDVILAARRDCPRVVEIIHALLHQQSLLRADARNVRLQVGEQGLSIPLHKDARRVYEKHGMIQRLPQDPWQEDLEKLWLSVITTLAGGVAGFILRGRQLFSRSERRKRWQEDQAHRVYADAHANVDTGLKGLAELREQIQNDFAARHLTALQVVALDTLVLDYLAKLRKRRTLLRPWVAPSLSRESRSTTPTTGSQGHQP